MKTLANQIFTLDQEKFFKKIRQYIEQMNIRLEWTNWHLSQEKQSWFIQNCWFWTEKNLLTKKRETTVVSNLFYLN